MPAYQLNVVAKPGIAIHIAVTRSATEALSVLRGTAQLHRRVWITDHHGNDVSEDELLKLAAAEKRSD